MYEPMLPDDASRTMKKNARQLAMVMEVAKTGPKRKRLRALSRARNLQRNLENHGVKFVRLN